MYTYVNDKMLTKTEWSKKHIIDIEFFDGKELVYGETYADYVKEFKVQMASQVKTRDWLRKEYLRLMKAPYNAKWAEDISEFLESFKDCFGVHAWFYRDMLAKKGITHNTVRATWKEAN